MKFLIEIEKNENVYKIKFEDDVAVTTITTERPIEEIRNLLRAAGIRGKKGRKKSLKPIDPPSEKDLLAWQDVSFN